MFFFVYFLLCEIGRLHQRLAYISCAKFLFYSQFVARVAPLRLHPLPGNRMCFSGMGCRSAPSGDRRIRVGVWRISPPSLAAGLARRPLSLLSLLYYFSPLSVPHLFFFSLQAYQRERIPFRLQTANGLFNAFHQHLESRGCRRVGDCQCDGFPPFCSNG